MMNGQWTRWIKEEALRLGFEDIGFARAERLVDDEARLHNWLSKNYHGGMHYMENHFDKRLDPRLLVDGAKTVITLIKNYYPEPLPITRKYKISRYAYGQDYHDVIRSQLKTLIQFMEEKIGKVNARGFVDSAPVLERSWALRSGLGWIGKNGNLITKKQGSYFFIATIIVDLDLEHNEPWATDYCGTCTRCIDACPTDAILPNKEINGSQCISYFTIELKEAYITTNKQWDNWIFGCDICQEVCPWNRFAKTHHEEQFKPLPAIATYDDTSLEELNEEEFQKAFKDSPIKRSKFSGFMRNIHFIKKSSE